MEKYMETWQSLMTKGNNSFNTNQWLDAEHYYQKAISLLDIKLHKEPKCIEAIQGWICGYHNLSDVFQETGDLAGAQKCLLIPHQSMIYMAENNNIDDEQKLIGMKAIKLTLTPLLEFVKKHPVCNSCFDQLMQQYQSIHCNQAIYH